MTKAKPDHYEVFVSRPPKGSVYEFHYAANELLDAEPPVMFSMRPIPLTDIMPPALRIYAVRNNGFLSEREKFRRERIEHMLAAAGLNRSLFVDPPSALKDLFDELDRGAMAIDMLLDRHMAKHGIREWLPISARVLFSAKHQTGFGSRAAAEFLNQGSLERGLTEDHVYRGHQAYLRRLRKLPQQVIVAEAYLTASRFRVLEHLRQELTREPSLRRFRGAELVQRADQAVDFCCLFATAVDDLGEQGRLPPRPDFQPSERENDVDEAASIASAPTR